MFLYQSGSLGSKVSQKHNTKYLFPSFLSHKSFQGASMPERDYPEQPLRAQEIFPANFISKLWELPDIPQGKLTS